MKMHKALLPILAIVIALISNNNVAAQQNKNASELFPIMVDHKCGFIDKQGKVVVATQFDCKSYELPTFSHGLAAVNVDNRWGYIDTSGRFVINPQFHTASSFSEGLALVGIKTPDGSKPAYIDITGKFVINPQVIGARSFSEGLAHVCVSRTSEGPKCGFINKTGRLVISYIHDHTSDFADFSEGLAAIKVKQGFVNKAGRLVVHLPEFDRKYRDYRSLGKFSEGLAAVFMGREGKMGYIDKTGKVSIKPQFDMAFPFSEGLARVEIGDRQGFIDKAGRLVINPQFDAKYGLDFYSCCTGFSEGLAIVIIGGKMGYIDRTGSYAINPQFDMAYPFKNGLALVQFRGGRFAYIDKTGKYIWNSTN